ncbi:hypothetical protein ACJX0J_003555 (mitochondrion) [Zea mays]
MYVSYFIVFPMHGKQLPNGVLYFTQVLAHFPLLFLFYQEIFALCSHFMHFTFGYSTWGLFQTCPGYNESCKSSTSRFLEWKLLTLDFFSQGGLMLNHTFCANGKEGDPDSLLPIEDYRIWLQAPVLFLLGFHFHDLPKDILFFLILILVFLFDIEEELKPIIIGFYNELGTFELTQRGNESRRSYRNTCSIFFLAVSPEIFLINATFILLIHGVRHELVLGVEKQAKEPTLDRRFQLPIFALESNPRNTIKGNGVNAKTQTVPQRKIKH